MENNTRFSEAQVAALPKGEHIFVRQEETETSGPFLAHALFIQYIPGSGMVYARITKLPNDGVGITGMKEGETVLVPWWRVYLP